jgi:DNA-binding IclR family transcriptional regulator
MKSPTRETASIQVIDRMAQLIDALARYDEPVSLKVLSAETGLHPSTAHRILAAAARHGLIDRTDTGSYRLGYRLMELGSRVGQGRDLREEARPIMEDLRDALGETVNLTVREGDEVVYVERAISHRMMRVEQVIGSRAPLHVTAVGKLMLGEGGDADIEGYARRSGLPAYTRRTLATLPTLKRDIHRSVKRGYALDDQEAEMGVGCIGVLVRDSRGLAVAGLSVSAPIERRRDEWIAQVVEAGAALSRRLGHRG